MLTFYLLHILFIFSLSCTSLYSMQKQQLPAEAPTSKPLPEIPQKNTEEISSPDTQETAHNADIPNKVDAQLEKLYSGLMQTIAHDEPLDETFYPGILTRSRNYFSTKKIETEGKFNPDGTVAVDEQEQKSRYFARHVMQGIQDALKEKDQEFLDKLRARILKNKIVPTTYKEFILLLHSVAHDQVSHHVKQDVIDHFATLKSLFDIEHKNTEQKYDAAIAEQQEVMKNAMREFTEALKSLKSEKANKLKEIADTNANKVNQDLSSAHAIIHEWQLIEQAMLLVCQQNHYTPQSETTAKEYTLQSLAEEIPNQNLRNLIKIQPEAK